LFTLATRNFGYATRHDTTLALDASTANQQAKKDKPAQKGGFVRDIFGAGRRCWRGDVFGHATST
jgi:hypothetical protein